jgi:hypothetical protein
MFTSRHVAMTMEVSAARETAASGSDFSKSGRLADGNPKENAFQSKGESKSPRRLPPLRGVAVDLIFSGALSAKELGGHYANDNCCSKNEDSKT